MSRLLPILFNGDMVRAILDGRKTVTRRLIKAPVLSKVEPPKKVTLKNGVANFEWNTPKTAGGFEIKMPYQPGDILYVQETWRVGAWDIRNQMIAFDYKDGTCGELIYIHDRELFERLVNQSREDARKAKCEYNGVDFIWEKGKSPCRWHPSIHMPKEAARIWLKVKDVRVERLQEMELDDFLAEGVDVPNEAFNDPENAYGFAKFRYSGIWTSTIKMEDNDRYGWEANPFVWVIEFERCEKPNESPYAWNDAINKIVGGAICD